MRRSTRSLLATVSFLLAALLAAAAAPVAAQQQHGSLYGPATDTEGNPLPGVTVTIQGPGGPQIQITNANGAFRFLGLDPAQYPLTASLDGFSTVDWPNVTIGASRNTTLQVELEVSPTEEVIVVTSESPLLDERKIQTGTTISQGRAGEDSHRPRSVVGPRPDTRRAGRPHQRWGERKRPKLLFSWARRL